MDKTMALGILVRAAVACPGSLGKGLSLAAVPLVNALGRPTAAELREALAVTPRPSGALLAELERLADTAGDELAAGAKKAATSPRVH